MGKNEVAKVEPHHLSRVPEPTTAILSDKDELFSQARIIQAMSKSENTANPNGADFVRGDVILYPAKKKIADLKTPLHVIFLRNSNEWVNFEMVKGQKQWRGEELRGHHNENLEIKYTLDGAEMERVRQITLYVLLPTQVEAFLKDAESESPTLSGSVSPIAIKFLNFNRRAAQEIMNTVAGTDFQVKNAIRAEKGLPAIPVYAYQHRLGIVNKTNDKGTFQIFSFEGSIGVKNPEVLALAKMAYGAVQARTHLKTAPVDLDQTQSHSEEDV